MLIDTHIFLWFQLGDAKLTNKNKHAVLEAYETSSVHLSAISVWEIAMLQKQGRIAPHQPIDIWIQHATQKM